jgi:cyanuric acid amidohydrolase
METLVYRVSTRSPSDVTELEALFAEGALRPEDVVAVLGKTEGNGGRNDFTRELAVRSVAHVLGSRLGLDAAAVEDRVVLSFSGGCEGVASPHLVVLARSGAALLERRPAKRLAVGVGRTRAFSPQEIGRRAQVMETARVVQEIARELRLDSLADIHLVQMKGAIPTASFEEAERAKRGGTPLQNDMAHSRAASALGAAVATGEVDEQTVDDAAINARWDLYSSVASVSAKPGLLRTEIMVLANSHYWNGDFEIDHGVMRDILDADAVIATLARLGITFPGRPSPDQRERIVCVFAKSEADPRGSVRGKRHVMLDDDDVSDTRWSRCTLAAVLASIVGDGRVYVSTRAEHMGPLGGGPVAIVTRA